jgi:hypothetical protein
MKNRKIKYFKESKSQGPVGQHLKSVMLELLKYEEESECSAKKVFKELRAEIFPNYIQVWQKT